MIRSDGLSNVYILAKMSNRIEVPEFLNFIHMPVIDGGHGLGADVLWNRNLNLCANRDY